MYQSKQYDGKLNERKGKEQKFIVNGWKKLNERQTGRGGLNRLTDEWKGRQAETDRQADEERSFVFIN